MASQLLTARCDATRGSTGSVSGSELAWHRHAGARSLAFGRDQPRSSSGSQVESAGQYVITITPKSKTTIIGTTAR